MGSGFRDSPTDFWEGTKKKKKKAEQRASCSGKVEIHIPGSGTSQCEPRCQYVATSLSTLINFKHHFFIIKIYFAALYVIPEFLNWSL